MDKPLLQYTKHIGSFLNFSIHVGKIFLYKSVLIGVILFILILTNSLVQTAVAASPRAPCDGLDPFPSYPQPAMPPIAQAVEASKLSDWTPPPCTSWQPSPITMLVALAGSIAGVTDVNFFLARFGNISEQRTIRYWSISDGTWRNLVSQAVALEAPDPKRIRPDFTTAELEVKKNLYFMELDNRSSSPVVYRLRVQELTPDRLVVEIENASPIRFFMLKLFDPGEVRSVYLFNKISDGTWGYYNLLSVNSGIMGSLVSSHSSSLINRAVALYRYLTGQLGGVGAPCEPMSCYTRSN